MHVINWATAQKEDPEQDKKYNYLNYLRVKPLVFSNTLSHMWDRLNLPMLLFKEGLLTLM